MSNSILNSYVVLINNNDRKYIDIVYHNDKIFKVSEIVELIYRRSKRGQYIFEISKSTEESEVVKKNLYDINK